MGALSTDSHASSVAFAASSTSSAVTSGTTGVTAFSCRSSLPNTYTTKVNPTTFTEECHVDYPVNEPSWNDPSYIIRDLAAYTVYTFQDCMEQCAKYNEQRSRQDCLAVSYNARLGPSVQKYGGNCWVKDCRGIPFANATDEDYNVVASAYITDAKETSEYRKGDDGGAGGSSNTIALGTGIGIGVPALLAAIAVTPCVRPLLERTVLKVFKAGDKNTKSQSA